MPDIGAPVRRHTVIPVLIRCTVVGAPAPSRSALNPRGAFVPIISFDYYPGRPIENAGLEPADKGPACVAVRGDCLFSVYRRTSSGTAYSPSRGDVDCSWLQGFFGIQGRD